MRVVLVFAVFSLFAACSDDSSPVLDGIKLPPDQRVADMMVPDTTTDVPQGDTLAPDATDAAPDLDSTVDGAATDSTVDGTATDSTVDSTATDSSVDATVDVT